jgi:MYXO-CTERM domain-containing protein
MIDARRLSIGLVLLFGAAMQARAMPIGTLIDFDLDGPVQGGFVDITGTDLGGVTITANGAQVLNLFGSPGSGSGFGTGSIQTIPFAGDPFRADFDVLATLVRVDLGDYGGDDADDLFLFAFDADDQLIDTAFDTLPTNQEGLRRLLVTGNGISYVEFGSQSTGPGSSTNTNSVIADNLFFVGAPTPDPVPAPPVAGLLATALLLLGVRRRRDRERHRARIPSTDLPFAG